MIFCVLNCEVRPGGNNYVRVELDLSADDILSAGNKDFWKELLDAMDRENIKGYLDLIERDAL
jgi:hypothetical protein